MRRQHYLKGTAAGLMLTVLLSGCSGQPAPTPAPEAVSTPQVESDPDEVLATVNGVEITRGGYERELARFDAGRAAIGLTPESEPGYRQQVLDLLIENELIRQRAAAEGITVSQEQIDAEIGAMVSQSGEEYFNEWLTSNLYEPDEFRRVVELDLLTRQLLEPVVAGVPNESPQANARHILVNSEEEAQQVLERLQAGEDFGALAAEYSLDVTTRDAGGDLGWFPRGGLLVPEVEEAAFGQSVDRISGVIQSDWGYHVVQTLGFEEARPIDTDTQQRLIEQAVDQWRQGLRSGADIQQMVTL